MTDVVNTNRSGISMPGSDRGAEGPSRAEIKEIKQELGHVTLATLPNDPTGPITAERKAPQGEAPSEVTESGAEVEGGDENEHSKLMARAQGYHNSQYVSKRLGKTPTDKELGKMTSVQLKDLIDSYDRKCVGHQQNMLSSAILGFFAQGVELTAPLIGIKSLNGFANTIVGDQQVKELWEAVSLKYMGVTEVTPETALAFRIMQIGSAVHLSNRGTTSVAVAPVPAPAPTQQ